jgi:hypothetical protein
VLRAWPLAALSTAQLAAQQMVLQTVPRVVQQTTPMVP